MPGLRFSEAKRFDQGEDNLTARLRGLDGGMVMIWGDAYWNAATIDA